MKFKNKLLLSSLLAIPLLVNVSFSEASANNSTRDVQVENKPNKPKYQTRSANPYLSIADGTGSGSVSGWRYKYTAEPYAFFYNVFTGEQKVIQVTSGLSHLTNTVIGEYATYNPVGYYYNYQHAEMTKYL